MEENPYAAPKAEVIEKKVNLSIDVKKVEYQKYRDEITSFTILLFCSLILLAFPLPVFLIGFCFCLGGIILSIPKYKKAKREYLDSREY